MVEKYIKYLLHNYDCVIIPDLGGFITSYASADVHPVRHTFLPPSKQIAFNERLKIDDGLLVGTVAKFEKITTEEAYHQVSGFVFDIRESLKENNKCNIKDLGTLFITQEFNLAFETDNKVNYDNESFGLPELFFKPIVRENVNSRLVAASKDRAARNNSDQLMRPRRRSSSSDIMLYLVGIPTVTLVVFCVYFFGFTDGSKNLGSLNPFQKTQIAVTPEANTDSSSLAEAREEADTNDNIADTSTPIVTDNKEPIIPKAPHEISKQTQASTNDNTNSLPQPSGYDEGTVEGVVKSSSEDKRYYVIVGSFSHVENASSLRDKLLDSDNASPKIIEPVSSKGLYKVSVADYDNLKQAQEKISAIQSSYKESLWVCKY